MSFSKTTQQVYDRSKTVTRRCGWWFLKPGDRLWAVEKAMGLKKGEKAKRIAMIEVVDVRREPLAAIEDSDVEREGFPGWSKMEFCHMFTQMNGGEYMQDVNRIEFKYVEEENQ